MVEFVKNVKEAKVAKEFKPKVKNKSNKTIKKVSTNVTNLDVNKPSIKKSHYKKLVKNTIKKIKGQPIKKQPYKRKLEKKGKEGTLKEQFNYYSKRYQKLRIKQFAYSKAIGKGETPYSLYSKLNYNDLYLNGLTRYVMNPDFKTVKITYKGEEAIKLQIESLKKATNLNYQADIFINNYTKSLEEVGMNQSEIIDIRNALNQISIKKLNYLINKDILPAINFVYSIDGSDSALYDLYVEIKGSINYINTDKGKEAYNLLNEKAKKYLDISKLEFEVEGVFDI